MKTFGLSILIFLFFPASFSYAQTFKAGLKLDSEHMSTGPGSLSPSFPLLSSLYITGTVFTANDLAFEARMGYNWEDHYKGIESGLFSKYYYKDLYAIGGIVYHHVDKEELPANYSSNYFTKKADLFMPALGLGFNPGRNFAIELLFQHGLNQKIGYKFNRALPINEYYHPISEVFPDVNLKWIVNIGMSYSFSF